MKLIRLGLAVVALITMAGLAYVAQVAGTAATGTAMSDAATKFLGTLSGEQKAIAQMPFESNERTIWYFVPRQDGQKNPTRKGLRMEVMSAEQREAALGLLKAGTSAGGYDKAVTIMSLESILNELERGGPNVRNPGWYFVSIFGAPGRTGKWGWRVEGHHLSVNYTLEDGQIKDVTPAFFGANPATVMAGPRQGVRAIPDCDDLACDLFRALDATQKQMAKQANLHPEVVNNTGFNGGDPKGIPGSKLTEPQRATLLKLIQAYTGRMPDEIARVELGRVEQAGLDKVHFAFAGGTEKGERRTYRVQGPSFVVEFLNQQADSANNPANHIHSVWRHLPRDFGLTTGP
jgi:hypothetical protein